MQSKKNYQIVALVFVSIVIGLLLGNFMATRNVQLNNPGFFNDIFNGGFSNGKTDEILELINDKYVDSVDVNQFKEELAAELLSKLDPHSVYIPAEDREQVNDELEGSFSGIGVQFNIQNDTVMIVAVISGGPSEKVGLLAGDRIIQVDDSAFTGKSISNEKVMKKLKGKENTKVKLKIKRYGTKELLTYTITRGSIPVNSVDIAYMVNKDVGLIKVNKFGAETYAEFLNGLGDLKAKGAKKFIVDLRENSGGYMEQCIMMVNEFLPNKQLIVYAEGKAYPRFNSHADGNGSCINEPVVVLIDEFSASASEIFAGAIQDNDRGSIIGRRSFGKGLVQQQFDLKDGSAVRLTVAKYFTPSGRSIQKPYEKGKGEDYAMDIYNRFMHGEFDHADSINKTDTVQYKTLKGRVVYGGGGIMPDIFVARDTTNFTPYFNEVSNYMYTFQYAFQFTDKYRNELKKFKDWKSLSKYLDSKPLLNEFVAYAKSKGVKPVAKDIQISGKLMTDRIKSYVIRNILKDEGFYPFLYQDDPTVIKALQVLK